MTTAVARVLMTTKHCTMAELVLQAMLDRSETCNDADA